MQSGTGTNALLSGTDGQRHCGLVRSRESAVCVPSSVAATAASASRHASSGTYSVSRPVEVRGVASATPSAPSTALFAMKKRKTGAKPADFARVRKKVGKATPAPSNATKTQFKYKGLPPHHTLAVVHSSTASTLAHAAAAHALCCCRRVCVAAIHVPTQNLKEGASGATAAVLVEQLHAQLSKLAHHNSTVRKGQTPADHSSPIPTSPSPH